MSDNTSESANSGSQIAQMLLNLLSETDCSSILSFK